MTGDWLPREHTTINHYLLSLTEKIMKDLTETRSKNNEQEHWM